MSAIRLPSTLMDDVIHEQKLKEIEKRFEKEKRLPMAPAVAHQHHSPQCIASKCVISHSPLDSSLFQNAVRSPQSAVRSPQSAVRKITTIILYINT